MSQARVLKKYYKIAVWDWKQNDYHGGWVVVLCSVPTKKKAKEIVAEYLRQGVIARWSNHLGGGYFYAD